MHKQYLLFMKLRPKYIKHIKKDLDQTKDLLICKIENSNKQLQCEIYDSYILVKYKRELHKIWSPQINITFKEDKEGTRIRGSIGPSGEIWLAFIFFYFFFALLFFGATSFAIMQTNLGHSASTAIYIAIFGLISVIGMYLISYIGQYKSKKQIEFLYSWIESSLEAKPKQ